MDIKTVEVNGVSKTFRVGFLRRKVEAVRGVSFDVYKGEIFGIVGPNGAGKTTTIKMMTGLVRPDHGSIRVQGKSVTDVETRRTLGYLPENPYFYEHLRVEELLRFYGQLHGIDAKILKKRIPELIEKVGLSHAIDRRLSKFSKGMRQRAGLAQALINDPELVILDEPQTGLDPFGRKDVRDLIFELKQKGKTVLFSSHILPDVEAVCDRVVLIHKGQVLDVGTLDELTGKRVKAYEVIARDVTQVPNHVKVLQQQGNAHYLEVQTESELQACLQSLSGQGATITSVTPRKEDLEDVLIRDMSNPEAK